MKRTWIIAAALLLLLGGGFAVYSGTRGLRNNNPGNIRKGAVAWLGEVPGTDPDFATFDTPEHGIRALGILLRNYQRRWGLDTVREIISRYAPSNENDTAAYVMDVAARLNVTPDERLNLNSDATLTALVQAVIHHENGVQPYSVATLAAGIGAA